MPPRLRKGWRCLLFSLCLFAEEPAEQIRLSAVRFRGNHVFSEAQLLPLLHLQPLPQGRWIRMDRLDSFAEELEADREILRRAYLQQGHVDVVIAEPDFLSTPEGLEILWIIHQEGPRHQIGLIAFEGDPLLPEALLFQGLGFRPGDPVSLDLLQERDENVRKVYLERGFPFHQVRSEALWREDAPILDLHFKISRLPRPRVQSMRVEGNTRTRTSVILREIPLQSGMMFDYGALLRGQAHLNARDWFEEVDLRFGHSGDPRHADVVVEVTEKPTGQLQTGISYADSEGASFLFQIGERNFSLRPPFRGDGDQLGFSSQIGSRLLRLEMGLDKIFFPVQSLDTHFPVQYEDNQFLSSLYSQRTLSTGAEMSFVLNRNHRFWFGPEWTQFDLYDIDPALSLREEDRSFRLSSLKLGWRVDHANRAFRPTEGFRFRNLLSIGTRGLGGDTDLLRTDSLVTGYYSPYPEHVLQLRAGLQFLEPYGNSPETPVPLRLALGGQENLRGYQYRSLFPRTGEGIYQGGVSLWWATAEYLLPFPGAPRLDLAFYYDLGDVSDERFSVSGEGPFHNIGVGVLIRAENFPVRFDAALPLKVEERDTENREGSVRYSFTAGYRF